MTKNGNSVANTDTSLGERGVDREEAGSGGINWERVVQLLGVLTGLVAWLGVVGGARTWARLDAAEIPALPTLAGLDQSWFIAEGLQTLVLPVLLRLGPWSGSVAVSVSQQHTTGTAIRGRGLRIAAGHGVIGPRLKPSYRYNPGAKRS